MKRSLGVCYYPEQWDRSLWLNDAKSMVKAGISWVRINEFSWSKLEPQPGEFRFEWLDEIIEILYSQKIKIVLGTPTAAPPRWMVDKYPDMLIRDKEGRLRKHGSRRHYCFSHKGYAAECDRIVELLAQRYGKNNAVRAWQTDNEYGCHDTAISYSESAKLEFQDWLRKKFKTKSDDDKSDIEALNLAWGNVFWSMQYRSFSEIELPNNTVTDPNPAHVMAFRKFSSHQVAQFNKRQVDIIRKFSNYPITHNFMGRITDFDHFKVGDDLDFASWDSYPLGFSEDRIDADESHKKAYARQGDPDFQAFHHDLYRSVGKGRFWVMEQQCGPVNWAPYNAKPSKNMLMLWTWEAFAHGAEVVSYFRWRQAPFAQEQMHSGLQLPDGTKTAAYDEVKEIEKTLRGKRNMESSLSQVAIIFDYDADAAWAIEPHGKNLKYFNLVFGVYRALRKLGQSIDIVPVDTKKFSQYKIVIAPGLVHMREDLKKKLKDFEGLVYVGPRTSTRNTHLNLTSPMPPNLPGFDSKITSTETFRSDSPILLEQGGYFCNYREELQGDARIIERTAAGDPAILKGGNFIYVAGWLDEIALNRLFKKALKRCNLEFCELPTGVRVRQNLKERFWFNYSKETVKVNGKSILGCSFFSESTKSQIGNETVWEKLRDGSQ